MTAAVPRGEATGTSLADNSPAVAVRRIPFVYALFALGGLCVVAVTAATRSDFDGWLAVLGVLLLFGLLLPLPGWVARWAPLVVIGALFLALGGLSARQSLHAQTMLPIDIDRAVTGVVVPVWLQQHLASLLADLGGALTLEYMLHYVAPLATALWLWRRHRHRFDGFVATYILAMVLGFVLYLAFPQTPPWYAAQHGLLPPLHRSIVDSLGSLHVGTLYAGADPEPFGAMPSLHVTVPVVVAAALIGTLRSRRRWLWMLYPLTVAFGVVLMAEHYLLDTLAGAALGVVAVVAVARVPHLILSGRAPDATDTLQPSG